MIALAKAMQAVGPPGLKCYILEPEISEPPSFADYPYVFLWGRSSDRLSGDDGSDSLADEYRAERMEVNATYVGLTNDSLVSAMEKFRAAWDRQIITVQGFVPSRLKQSGLQNVMVDRQAPQVGNLRPRFAVDRYTFIADRL